MKPREERVAGEFIPAGRLSMVYWTASRNETQKRTFDPYDLVLAPDDDWCLIGHCHLRNDIRLFKVQRVRSAVETGECFCRPAGFRARDYMAESFGTIRGDGDFHVVLRFTQAYAGRIAEKQWHATPMTNLGGLCLELLSGKGLESAFLEGIGLKHETVLCHHGAVFPKTPMETRTVPWLHRLRLPPRGHLPNGHNGEPSVLSRSRVRCVSFSPLKSGNKSNKPPASTVAGTGFAGHCNPSS